jgi:tetratricopeptide (TPR) repeat protein
MAFKIRMISKKQELKKPDEFISTVDRLTEMALSHRKHLLLMAGLLIMVGAIVVGVFWYQIKQEQWAAALEFEAASYYHQPVTTLSEEEGAQPLREENLRKAIDQYREVVTRYPRTKSAALSQYYLGNSYLELGDHEQAIAAYQAFIRQYSHSSSLVNLVRQRLAYAYLGQGDLEAAKRAFEDVIALEGALNKDQALYELGRLYEGEGKKEEAIQRYQAIVDNQPGTIFTAEARVRLRDLGVIETEASPSGDPSKDSSTMTVETPPKDVPVEVQKDSP